jgi:diphthine synthase
VEQLIEAEGNRGEGAYSQGTKCFGLARVGAGDQVIRAGPLGSFLEKEMGGPLHSFVICAEKLHHMEEEMF